MVIVKERIVEFRFYRPQAKEVCLVGDFTGWRCGEIRMMRDDGGYWHAQVPLELGIFHFRYLADGEWFTDDATPRIDDGPFGVDSVLWVLPRSRQMGAGRPAG